MQKNICGFKPLLGNYGNTYVNEGGEIAFTTQQVEQKEESLARSCEVPRDQGPRGNNRMARHICVNQRQKDGCILLVVRSIRNSVCRAVVKHTVFESRHRWTRVHNLSGQIRREYTPSGAGGDDTEPLPAHCLGGASQPGGTPAPVCSGSE